jgi:hypothetical protein
MPAKTSCASWLRAPAPSAIVVWVGLPLTTKVPLAAAAALAADKPRMSASSSRRSRWRTANTRAVAALCAMIITKQETATGSSARVSLQVTTGIPITGSPPGTRPITVMPRPAKSYVALAAIVPTTAISATGSRGAKR